MPSLRWTPISKNLLAPGQSRNTLFRIPTLEPRHEVLSSMPNPGATLERRSLWFRHDAPLRGLRRALRNSSSPTLAHAGGPLHFARHGSGSDERARVLGHTGGRAGGSPGHSLCHRLPRPRCDGGSGSSSSEFTRLAATPPIASQAIPAQGVRALWPRPARRIRRLHVLRMETRSKSHHSHSVAVEHSRSRQTPTEALKLLVA